MEDALTILQKGVINKQNIAIHGERIQFGKKYSWPGNVKTNYIIYGTGKNGVPQDHYTLKSLVFFLQKIHLQHSIYVREAVNAKIQVVQRPDRRNLLAFLNGEISTTDSIDKCSLLKNMLVAQVQISKPTKRIYMKKRLADNKEEETNPIVTTKRRRLNHIQQSTIKNSTTKENIILDDTIPDENNSLSEIMILNTSEEKQRKQKRITIKNRDILKNNGDIIIILKSKNQIEHVHSHDRRIRNRKTILQSENKEFAKKTFDILQNIERLEIKKSRSEQLQQLERSAYSIDSSIQHSYYNKNYDCNIEEIQKDMENNINFNNNTTKIYQSITLKSVENNNKQMSKKIFHNNTDNNIMIQKTYLNMTPIIIISYSNLSLITSVNATDILEKLTFIPKEKKGTTIEIKKDNEIKIQRPTGNGLIMSYRIIEDPLKLDPRDWKNVVGIFVVGTTWQFKKWPIYNGNPAEICSKIPAFHLKYDDTPLNENIQRWSVKIINMSRTKQHCNRMALMQFWTTLDKEMSKNKHFRL